MPIGPCQEKWSTSSRMTSAIAVGSGRMRGGQLQALGQEAAGLNVYRRCLDPGAADVDAKDTSHRVSVRRYLPAAKRDIGPPRSDTP